MLSEQFILHDNQTNVWFGKDDGPSKRLHLDARRYEVAKRPNANISANMFNDFHAPGPLS